MVRVAEWNIFFGALERMSILFMLYIKLTWRIAINWNKVLTPIFAPFNTSFNGFSHFSSSHRGPKDKTSSWHNIGDSDIRQHWRQIVIISTTTTMAKQFIQSDRTTANCFAWKSMKCHANRSLSFHRILLYDFICVKHIACRIYSTNKHYIRSRFDCTWKSNQTMVFRITRT